MTRHISMLVLTLAAVAGCSPVPATSPESQSLSSNRVVLARGGGNLPPVSVILPPTFQIQQGGGVDTQHAEVRGPGIILSSDYGRVGGRQVCGTSAGCKERSGIVDGREATWVRYAATSNVGGVGYAERLVFAVRAVPTEDPSKEPPNFFLLNGLCATHSGCDLVERIALSTRFG